MDSWLKWLGLGFPKFGNRSSSSASSTSSLASSTVDTSELELESEVGHEEISDEGPKAAAANKNNDNDNDPGLDIDNKASTSEIIEDAQDLIISSDSGAAELGSTPPPMPTLLPITAPRSLSEFFKYIDQKHYAHISEEDLRRERPFDVGLFNRKRQEFNAAATNLNQ